MTANQPLRIDVHTHLITLDEKNNGGFLHPRMLRNPFFRIFALKYGYIDQNDAAFDHNYLETLARDVRESDSIDKAVVLGMDGVYDGAGRLDRQRTMVYVPNDYVFKSCAANPDIFLPGPSVNPDRADALDELDRCHANGAALIKWLPNTMHFDPMDGRYSPFYKKLSELKLPLLSHTGYEHAIPGGDQPLGRPERLRLALDDGVTVIAGHAGANGIGHPNETIDIAINMLLVHPNFYGDIGALTGPTRYVYLKQLFSDPRIVSKLFQATDYPAPPFAIFFWRSLSASKIVEANKLKNIFSKDIFIKLALGMPNDILTNFHNMIYQRV